MQQEKKTLGTIPYSYQKLQVMLSRPMLGYIYSLYSCVREGIIMKEHEQAILYLCDGKKCEQCDPDFCSHTTDINHAKNFIKSWGDFIEVESKENSWCT